MDRDKMLDMLQSYAGTGVYRRVPVSREIYADAFTPIEVMRTLRAASRHCYLLESAEDRQQWGRYSFLGYAPVMEITCTDGHMTIAEGKEDEEKTIREFDTEDPGPVKLSLSWKNASGEFTEELWGIWISEEIWIPASPSVWHIKRTELCAYSSGQALWRTACRRGNTKSAGIRRARCAELLNWRKEDWNDTSD